VVEKGQVLAILDEASIRSQIESIENTIYETTTLGSYKDRQTAADIGIAKVELQKMRAANASEQACAEKELEIQKMELQLKQTQELRNMEVSNKYKSLQTLKESMKHTRIVAPFSGRIVYIRDIKRGASVRSYDTMLCIADDTRVTLRIQFDVDNQFREPDKMYAQIMDEKYDLIYHPYDKEVYTSMILSGAQLDARFTVVAEPGEVEIGQYAVVMALYNYQEDVLTIPVNALYQDRNGKYAYKMVDGKRVRCDITTGFATETKVEVLTGLTEGDVVCVND
jgi:multidrug efflux pump subunit AcrA (membrane-fusion protein)